MKTRLNPCTQCGDCCKAEICPIGKTLLSPLAKPPCPALRFVDGKHWCWLVVDPADFIDLGGKENWRNEFISGMLKQLSNFGYGCDNADKYVTDESERIP